MTQHCKRQNSLKEDKYESLHIPFVSEFSRPRPGFASLTLLLTSQALEPRCLTYKRDDNTGLAAP